ncbi:MAG: UDP-N-acetylglucosamine--N-acetylmuramyl-(pentapeptide) pyrophosphoryl-undecaprenol N-acetylglucosamine transferase [Anaerolineae bacterium]|nr:UDP-N-acetylglucosamine--N-acetylmuramyl-(pentapeptide) pyrophosphoryl-undecaprenol N-acetylglucosamine transferase [Anaerolineae bacterium]
MSRIMISAGGTGGGVYPALSVAAALRKLYSRASADAQSDSLTMTFVGARGDMARDLVAREKVDFDGYHEILAGPLHGVPRVQQIMSAIKILIGVLQSIWLVIRLRPQVLFLTGGWVGFPVAAACWLLRVPIVIYVPDIEPGLALKVLGRYFARIIAATVQATAEYFPGKEVVETGYPLRGNLQHVENVDRDAGIAHFNLDPNRRTLLVFGGSRGARSINRVLMTLAPDLIAQGVQILHLTGNLDWENVQADHAALSADIQAHYQIMPYLSDMRYAFLAADLVISRAGAATLAEYPEFGLPALLVPYPYAWRYQKINADWLVDRGAALRLNDETLATDLLPVIRDLLGTDQHKLNQMRSAMAALKRSDGAVNIARLLVRTAQG